MMRSGLYSRVLAIRAVGLAFVVSAVITVGVVTTKPAEATFPGENGRITFSSIRDGDSEISTMRPDGTGVKQLTRNAVEDFSSAFSPDGKKIVFARDILLSNGSEDREIYVMNADGTGVKRLTFNSRTDFSPIFSPNGKKTAPRASFKLAEHRSSERESREPERPGSPFHRGERTLPVAEVTAAGKRDRCGFPARRRATWRSRRRSSGRARQPGRRP